MIYLKWLEYDVKVFNVGQLRRSRARQKAQKYDYHQTRFESLLPDESSDNSEGVKEEHNASWFSHQNAQANQSREQLAHDSLEMLIQWLKDGGNVGIHGARFIAFNLYLGGDQNSSICTSRCDEQYAHAKVSKVSLCSYLLIKLGIELASRNAFARKKECTSSFSSRSVTIQLSSLPMLPSKLAQVILTTRTCHPKWPRGISSDVSRSTRKCMRPSLNPTFPIFEL